MDDPWRLALVPALIGLNAFFVSTEYALVAFRPAHEERLAQRKLRATLAAIRTLRGEMAASIGAIQVCITMTNLLLGWIGEPAMSDLLNWLLGPVWQLLPPAVGAGIATAVGFLIVTLLTVVLSELVPKAVTLQRTLSIVRITAVPMVFIMRMIRPLVWLMNTSAQVTMRALGLGNVRIDDAPPTAEEIGLIARQAGEAGTVNPQERSLILNALALGKRTARQIMVPRVKMVFLDIRLNMEDNLARMGERLFSRLPLCDGGLDRVLGLVYTKEFLTAFQVKDADSSVLQLIARPAVFAPASISLHQLLTTFAEKRSHLIFLVDEYGGVEGMVTLTDVIDELIGEMREAGEEEPDDNGATHLHFAGDTPLHELAERLKHEPWPASGEVTTIGGLITARLGRIPLPGQTVEIDDLVLKITESDQRRIQSIELIACRTAPSVDREADHAPPD